MSRGRPATGRTGYRALPARETRVPEDAELLILPAVSGG